MNNLVSRANLHSSKTYHKVSFSIYKQRVQPFGKFQFVTKNSFNSPKPLSFTYRPSNNLLTRQTPPILDFKRHLAIDNNTTDKTPQTTSEIEKSSTTPSTTASLETAKQESKAAKLETLANVKPSFIDRTKAFLKPLPGKIWHELVNLWNGSKLLAYEVRICSSFIKKLMNGQSLSRREKRQLLRTSADLLRLVPFIIILVVPFLEFALPVLLKLFPNMLPSTFTDSMKKEEMKKQQLQVKLEVASFLQQAVHERAKSLDKDNVAVEFANYIEKVQQGGTISNTELVKFAHFFEDEFTLDNLQREQLIAMCKYMQLNTFGTNGFLRYQMTNAINKIKKDDRLIESEGVESLTLSELQQACAARGLKGTSRSKYYLQERLREWLDLSLTRNLPISLLILANAFKITAKISPKDALREALYHIPDSLLDELKLKVSEAESAKLKLEVLKKEEQAIKQEELEAPKTTKEIQREQLLEWILQKQDIAQSSVTFTASQLKAITDAVGKLAAETTLEKEQKQILELKQVLEKKKKELAEKEEEIKLKRKLELEQAEIEKKKAEEELTKKLMDSPEELDIEEIEKKRKELVLEEELEEKKREREEKRIQKETKSLNRIEGILETFVKDIEDDLKEVTESSKVFNILDKDKDGVVSVEEIKEAAKLLREKLPEEALTVVIDSLDADHDGKISLEELKPLADKMSEGEKEKKDEVKAPEIKEPAEVKDSAEVKEVKETVQPPVEVKEKSQSTL